MRRRKMLLFFGYVKDFIYGYTVDVRIVLQNVVIVLPIVRDEEKD